MSTESQQVDNRHHHFSIIKTIIYSVLLGLVIFLSASAFFANKYKSINGMRWFFEGKQLIASTEIAYVKDAKTNEDLNVDFELRNVASDEVAIVGSRLSCDCITMEKIPIKIKPHATSTLSFKIDKSSLKEPFMREIVLYTNMPSQPQIILKIIK
jgi:hypothetical protein